MSLEELCDQLRAAEATSYGRPISSAAHTRIVARLRRATGPRGAMSRPLAVVTAIGLGLLFTLHTSLARPSVARAALPVALGYDGGAQVDALLFGDGGEEISPRELSDAAPGGPRQLP